MKKLRSFVTGINLVIAIVVVNIFLLGIALPQFDLTFAKVHSLSTATKDIIRNLDDLVNIKVYMSQDLPAQIKPVAEDLRSMLTSIEKINQSKFKVEYVDPAKDEQALKETEKYNIAPLQFSSVKNDKFEVQNSYFGMVMQYGGKDEVIPIASDVGNLEYMIVSSIKRLTTKELPTVVVYEDSDQPSGEAQLLQKYLGYNYKIEAANFDDDKYELPSKGSTLLIIGRKSKFTDKAIDQISNWVAQGKGLMIFDERVAVNNNMQARKLEETGLERLMADKGIVVEPKIVMDSNGAIANFRSSSGTFLTQYLYWPQIRPENINSAIPAMAGITSLTMAWASPVDVSGKAEVLFSSSDKSAANDSFSDLSPQKQSITGDMKKFGLGAINISDGKLAVIGDTDFIKDQFVTNNQNNLLMVLNLVDYLSNDSSLLKIRGKILTTNPLREIGDGLKNLIKYGNIAVPVVLLGVIYGVIYGINKRKNQNKIKELN